MTRSFLLCVCLSIPACTQTVSFELHQGFLIVSKCSVGNLRNLTAVIDTGVTETTLDLRVAKRLSLTMRPDAATVGTRSANVQAVSIPRIEFGPLRSESLSGIAADLSPLTYRMGIRPDVLIGMDLLGTSKFIIDYKAKTITFGETPLLKHSARLLPETRLALLDATADAKSLRLQIDTGFNAILIYGGKLRASPLQELDSHSAAFGLRLNAQPAFVGELQIGDWKGKRVTAYVTDEVPAGAPGFDGLFGPTALGIRRLAFDLESHIITWE
ncbi:MAG TPA: retropepsin-like aspartic protease [Terriglobales bacterium]|nr:retropepsin-like aspartic protease [Terriglobales bacterium]